MAKGKGRPTLCTPEIIAAIANNMALPMPFKYACEREGINESTGYDWLNRGEQGEEPYNVFSQAVTRARANGVMKLTEHALAGGRGSQNAAWLLERRYRDEYGPTQRIEHSGPGGKPIEVKKSLAEMSDEELERLAGVKTE